jgi:hypothetical protein
VRTKTLRKQQRIWNIQNRRDLRFTEREKVAHHRTDYQVTIVILFARRVVCTGFERAKSGHLIVCPLIFFSLVPCLFLKRCAKRVVLGCRDDDDVFNVLIRLVFLPLVLCLS